MSSPSGFEAAHCGRRRALQAASAAAMLGALALALAPAQATLAPAGPATLATPFWRRPRMLWVTRPQGQEAVRTVYWADGALLPEGYAALTRIYRDVQADVQWPIALGLLDLNFLLQVAVHRLVGPRPLVLLSGYRTRATNRSVGGTEPNIHGLGLADDYRYEGLSLYDNFRLARRFQVGGLGLYPERGSLHKDIGRRRSWITRGRAQGARHEHASFR